MCGRPGPTWKVSVSVPPEKAYAYVADVGRHGEWGSQADEMTIKADQAGEPSVGKTYVSEGTLLGKRNSSKVTITNLDPPNCVEFEYEDPRGVGGHVFTFTPQGGGTLITRQIYGIKQPSLGPLFFLLFKRKIDVNYNGALNNLKTRLETGATLGHNRLATGSGLAEPSTAAWTCGAFPTCTSPPLAGTKKVLPSRATISSSMATD